MSNAQQMNNLDFQNYLADEERQQLALMLPELPSESNHRREQINHTQVYLSRSQPGKRSL